MAEGVGATNNSSAIQQYEKFANEKFAEQLHLGRINADQGVKQQLARNTGDAGR